MTRTASDYCKLAFMKKSTAIALHDGAVAGKNR